MQKLRDHKNVHTGEKPYKCKYCSTCFASVGNHRMHERKVHEGYNPNVKIDNEIIQDEINEHTCKWGGFIQSKQSYMEMGLLNFDFIIFL